MLTVSEASQRIRALIRPLGPEIVALSDALGCYLATDIVATRNLPPCHNSAMDGFAVRAADVPGTLPVSGTIAAGDAPTAQLLPGTAWRIMTGAPMPAGADTVVIQEEASDHGDKVAIAISASPGDNVRATGEDVAVGETVLRAGMLIGPGEIGMLAALGHATVAIGRRPRVAVMSTGDELVGVDVAPKPGQIVNSNAYALAAQIREAGGIPVMTGIAPDHRDTLLSMVQSALMADVLVTSGGVSVGNFDYVKGAFAEAGVAIDFWKVAMKPGKPLAFGLAEGAKPIFGLPGNPVSSMVVFELFTRPALLAMQGAGALDRPQAEVVLSSPYSKSPGRAHYVRATLRRAGDTLYADLLAKQGSGMLSSMVAIDALVVIDRELADVAAGTRVPALLLRAV